MRASASVPWPIVLKRIVSVSPATWKMLNGRRSNASFIGNTRTWTNCPGCTRGAMAGARMTNRKYGPAARSLATIWAVCSNMVAGCLNFVIRLDGRAAGFVQDPHGEAVVNQEGIGRHAVEEEDIGADGAAGADDRLAAHNGGAGVNGDMIFDGGMAFLAAQLLAAGERARHQADALVHFDVVANGASFAHDRARAVVDEEVRADPSARREIDAGAEMRPLRQ